MCEISGRLKRALWPLVEARVRELDARRPRGRRRQAVVVCSVLLAVLFLLGSAGMAASSHPIRDYVEYDIENGRYRENLVPPEPEPVGSSQAPPSYTPPAASHASPAPINIPPPSNFPGRPIIIPPPENKPEPDFTVDISPDSRTILNKIKVHDSSSGALATREVEVWNEGKGILESRVNRRAEYTVTVRSVNGFRGTVRLSLSGVPSGASAPLPSSVSVPKNGSAIITLTVTTTSSTPGSEFGGKSYTLKITGTHNGVTRSDSAELRVEERTICEGTNGFSGPVYDDSLSGSSGYTGSITRSYAWRVDPATSESMYIHHTDPVKWSQGVPLIEAKAQLSVASLQPAISNPTPPSTPSPSLTPRTTSSASPVNNPPPQQSQQIVQAAGTMTSSNSTPLQKAQAALNLVRAIMGLLFR